ncbi:MAG TPA: helicase-related protein [Burkholderiaceae bacterium]|nr:helicase-related protein [Burkholderiaceae bacterium]
MDKKETRHELARMAANLLLGPMQENEVLGAPPGDTYLTGILWPQGAVVSGEEDDTGGTETSGGMDEDESAVPGYRAVRPCSIGITFAVDAAALVTVDLGQTARYHPTVPDQQAAGVGEEKRRLPVQWTRVHLGYSFTMDPSETRESWKVNEFQNPSGSKIVDNRVSVHVRRRVAGSQLVFTVTLINDLREDSNDIESRDARCLFQSEVRISAQLAGGVPAIQPRFQIAVSEDDEDALTNSLLYRDVHEYAVGHGIAATWDDLQTGAVEAVRTAWLPEASVAGTDPRGSKLLKSVTEKFPDMLRAGFLSQENSRKDVVSALEAFAGCYKFWIEEKLENAVGQFSGTHRKAANFNLKRCEDTAARITSGIEILKKNNDAWTAFTLANKAMDRQSHFPAKEERQGPLVWRPFQLAFMLLVIPGLVEESGDDRNCMDLLWFPTGGGKTEAYLGITAFQIFYRRLTSGTRRDSGGVDVLMRYTLRLLTVQQFQRAAALITASDMIRGEDKRLGNAPITLGLYVGGEATPNKMDDARTAIRDEHAGLSPKSTPRQLLRCPVCGTDLPASGYRAHATDPVIEISCQNKGCGTGGRALPVLTVDDPIYASPPSLLIGTIDKFAQIPRSTSIRRLFGIDSGLRPGLIIQDELHLISGPLGSMAGLYETVVDFLCTKDGIRPKIIGSTATIGQAGRQVKALFDRSVLQFPPPGFDAADSFFAVRDDKGDDRLYIGIPSAGRSPKFALQAVVASLLQSAAAIRASGTVEDSDIDPYWTCVAYFNSLRELGGAHVLLQDDVPRQMQFLATRLNTPVRNLEHRPEELSSRVSSRDLPAVLQSLEAGLQGGGDLFGDSPRDAVLASNMISVGVDVPRLGLMVVNGQPKSTAEYIQASSRVGRGMPGLVYTLYNFGRPRDLSHFEHFRGYHGALYRRVEATSVTPWAPRARDKALHAVLIAAIRHLVPGMSGDEDASKFAGALADVDAILARIEARIEAGTEGVETEEALVQMRDIVQQWALRSAEAKATGSKLNYWEKKAPFGKTTPYLMYAAEEGNNGSGFGRPTPNTMREVEPSTAFVFKRIPKKIEDTNGNQ